ncbi:MAG: GNAT family N-acetyltransferase, partial [Planctomycetota bacterium]
MRSGSLRVRAADPKAEREAILRVLERNLPRAVQPGRYDWLYLGNPRGPALVWVAEDESTGAVVGVSAAHRRRVRVRGVVAEALNLGDFAIDAEYRALGPALQLLRATLEPVREGRFAFSFDHMNDAMQAAYRRIEGASFGGMERFVRPVRA